MATEIRVPTLGESVSEATIAKWFKKPGDAVTADEPLVELETDKVTLEVPAPAAGILGDIAAKDGETVGPGALLGSIDEGGAAAPAPSRTVPRIAPGPTVSPSLATMSPIVPDAGAFTSRVTLSVSSSTSGSSALTESPGFLNQRPIVASETDSPSVGTRISVAMIFSFALPRSARAVLATAPNPIVSDVA